MISIRPGIRTTVVFVLSVLTATGSAISADRVLTIEERTEALRALEGVRRAGPVAGDDTLRARVEDDLRGAAVLRSRWGVEVDSAMLAEEIDRMASHSRRPALLAEMFRALGNDPALIAESLARPVVTGRLLRAHYSRDRSIHDDTIRQATTTAVWATDPGDLARSGAEYVEIEWVRGAVPARSPEGNRRRVALPPPAWDRLVAGLPPVGGLAELEEREDRFVLRGVLARSEDSVVTASAVWRKTPFDEWWETARSSESLDSPAPASASTTAEEITGASCADDIWSPTDQTGAPDPRFAHTAVWTGTEMIVWGGFVEDVALASGARYEPATDTWTPVSTLGAPGQRSDHTAVWTGTEMIVWGGWDGTTPVLADGGRYSPATDAWSTMDTASAPSARTDHTAVWTGAEMIVWGGSDGGPALTDTGGRYDPAADTWTATATAGAPAPRHEHTAVWSESEMIVWGGFDSTAPFASTGGRYDPVSDAWTATTDAGVPAGRWHHTAVWTGTEMIVWGGEGDPGFLGDGAAYDPSADGWAALPAAGAPAARDSHTAVWTETEMIVWGGWDENADLLDTGGRYDTSEGAWTPTTGSGAPAPRFAHTAVWAGEDMIAWGGTGVENGLDTGGRYCAAGIVVLDLTVAKNAGAAELSWPATENVLGHDVVRGELAALRSSLGDFAAATTDCLADDITETSVIDAEDPPAGDGFWYLVRPLFGNGPGSYDSGGDNQAASRDAGIGASPDACP